MKLLVVSNGYGEDHIACALIQATEKSKHVIFDACPLVGDGQAYKAIGVNVCIEQPVLPSGGFIRSIQGVFRDIVAGLCGQIGRQRRFLRSCRGKYEKVICVGDVYCLWMAHRVGAPTYFLPTAKSHAFQTHSWLERVCIKRWATHVFPRDELTTNDLKAAGIQASYVGNYFMDLLSVTGASFTVNESEKLIGILPGSRQEAYKNCAYILSVIPQCVTKSQVSYVIAWPPTLPITPLLERIQPMGWAVEDTEKKDGEICTLTHFPDKKISVTSLFGDVLANASLCIGLAGTANEQAVYSGVPVICFEGFGEQTTKKRFKEQKKLLGPLLHVVDRSPDAICEKVAEVLNAPSKLSPRDITVSATTEIIKKIHS